MTTTMGDIITVTNRSEIAGWTWRSSANPLDDQSWFWTAEWQEGEKEADMDKKAGRIIHLSLEDIRNRMHELDNPGKQG